MSSASAIAYPSCGCRLCSIPFQRDVQRILDTTCSHNPAQFYYFLPTLDQGSFAFRRNEAILLDCGALMRTGRHESAPS